MFLDELIELWFFLEPPKSIPPRSSWLRCEIARFNSVSCSFKTSPPPPPATLQHEGHKTIDISTATSMFTLNKGIASSPVSAGET